MSVVKIPCNQCGQVVQLKAEMLVEYQGKSFRCKSCDAVLKVPRIAFDDEAASESVPEIPSVPKANEEDHPDPKTAEPTSFAINVEPAKKTTPQPVQVSQKQKNLILFGLPIALLLLIAIVIIVVSNRGDSTAKSSSQSDRSTQKKRSTKKQSDNETTKKQRPGAGGSKGPDGKVENKLGAAINSLEIENPPAKENAYRGLVDWEQSFEKAKERAQRNDKEILLLFNVSDSQYGEQANAEIFARPEFNNLCGGSYEFVHIDFPTGDAKKEVQDSERNANLARYFRIQKFPVVLLADKLGRPIHFIDLAGTRFNDFEAMIRRSRNYMGERSRWVESVNSMIKQGETPDLQTIQYAIPAGFFVYYLDMLEEWKDVAAKQDSSNQNGLNENLFILWWMAKYDSIEEDEQKKMRELTDSLEAWLASVKRYDPTGPAYCYLCLSRLSRRFDIDESMRHAKSGLKFKPLSASVETQLASLASDAMSMGTGFFIANNGLVLTNAHVVGSANQVEIKIGSTEQEKYIGQVLDTDVENDLALVKVNDLKGRSVPGVAFLDRSIGTGQEVMAVGFAAPRPGVLAERSTAIYPKVSTPDDGVSVPTKESIDGMIKLDKTVNPGTSGGPVFTSAGIVAGVVTAKTYKDDRFDSFGLAIPIRRVKAFLESKLDKQNLANVKFNSVDGKAGSWTKVDEIAQQSLARIVVRAGRISLADAVKKNSQVWSKVKNPNLDANTYHQARKAAADFSLTWPVGSFLNTLGVSQYRCEMYSAAIGTLERAAKANVEQYGRPSPVDVGFLALAYFKKDNSSQEAKFFRREFESLMLQQTTDRGNDELQMIQQEIVDLMGK